MTSIKKALRVCYFGTYRAEYSRNRIMIEGLRSQGVEVIECHSNLWHGVGDRVQVASGGWARPAFWWRVLTSYIRLLRKYFKIGRYDILVVGYPGHYDVFLARWLARLRRKPLVWDVLNSLYLIILERGIASRHPISARIIHLLEKMALNQADRMILDCEAFVDWFSREYAVDSRRFSLVPIGADDAIFQKSMETDPVHLATVANSKLLKVLYYGSYIPNHGVQVIVEAARLLRSHPEICFEMVGNGPDKQMAQSLAEGLENVTFIDWLEKPALVTRMTGCDIVLGTFGDTLQARLTNNNKIYEAFACKKAVISASTDALPSVLKHGEHVFLCARGDAGSLAKAILELQAHPELAARLGENGYRLFHEQFDVRAIGTAFTECLTEISQQ